MSSTALTASAPDTRAPGAIPRLALTAGEPAGIGPDLLIALAHEPGGGAQRVAIGDPDVVEQRAQQLGQSIHLIPFDPEQPRTATPRGSLEIVAVPAGGPVHTGILDPRHAAGVLAMLGAAADGCLDSTFDAMVTGPVHKGVINRAGIPFSGHTEWLAERAGAPMPVMMLATDSLRVALVTTHLSLRDVPDAITAQRIEAVTRVLHHDLTEDFGIERPRIGVCGLNPHAGEDGVLGREEIDIITPTLDRLRAEGLDLRGPLPADTAFTPRALAGVDAVLAMYHDQGLPVLKHAGFGHAINVTLGLPFVRTSVDHGTALDLAGSGRAEVGSFLAAEGLARELARHRLQAQPAPSHG